MLVTPIAHTKIIDVPEELRDTEFFQRDDWADTGYPDPETADIDLLAEVAGRGCYKSWDLPNPKTATNEGYLANILDQTHYSVLEHGSVTFYVEHVSRALLLELERHRHASFSVESQRFVDTGRHHPEVVLPPLMQEEMHVNIADMLQEHYELSLKKYKKVYNYFRDEGVPVKQSREAARAFLLESTPVDLVWTGNIRAMRDMLGKRWHMSADAEIREFAGLVLGHLRALAPHSIQDLSEEPYED